MMPRRRAGLALAAGFLLLAVAALLGAFGAGGATPAAAQSTPANTLASIAVRDNAAAYSASAAVYRYFDLAPAFSPGTNAYTVTVPNSVSTVRIEATRSRSGTDTLSSSSNTGAQTVNVGSNLFTITVVPPSGSGLADNSYTVTVTRSATDIDYDDDDDGLIDVRNLAQLDAIRYDLDGNGVASALVGYTGHTAAYDRAFRYAVAGLGCKPVDPDGAGPMTATPTCSGYELRADLDFDTDGDGATYTLAADGTVTGDSGDAYYNGGAGWTPIADFEIGSTDFVTTFDGNGHTISNLFVNGGRSISSAVGLFGYVGHPNAEARIRNVGLVNVYVKGGTTTNYTGGLAGNLNSDQTARLTTTGFTTYGEISASYVTGSVSGIDQVGGLAGQNDGSIRASYSHAAVTGSARVGGLVGKNSQGIIYNSYATGPVTATSDVVGGLAGDSDINSQSPHAPSSVRNSYWDLETSCEHTRHTDSTAPRTYGRGKTTAELITPTGYAGIYVAWDDLDVDEDGNSDDVWSFRAGRYPVLKSGGHDAAEQANAQRIDYDCDDDGLIEITRLAQLNAVRYDLDGDGAVDDAANSGHYAAVYPIPADGMGCQLVGATTPARTCTGYELGANSDSAVALDFDTDGDYDVDSNDAYPNWAPIGTYTATFKGNNHRIANLTINAGGQRVGLFSRVSGAISGVGLPNASVTATASPLFAGVLAGQLDSGGTVTSSWATGSVAATDADTNSKTVGGLIGFVDGGVPASYSGVTVTAATAATQVRLGSLAGWLNNGTITASYATGAVSGGTGSASHVGGLVGVVTTNSTITASYATGTVTSSADNVGGLAGSLASGATVGNSYWDTTTSGITGTGAGAGQITTALQSPTAYGATGIYSAWDVDLDGETGGDDPWDFGSNAQYPALKYDGLDTVRQGRGTFNFAPTALTVGEGAVASYTVALSYRPDAAVTVAISGDADDGVTIDGPDAGAGFTASETLSFTVGNWNVPQTVRVRAAHDADLRDDTATLTHAGGGLGSSFERVKASLTVTITDDDRGSIALTRNGAAITTLSVSEEGGNVAYDVGLSSAPRADVTVTVTSGNAAVEIHDGGSTFNPMDFSSSRTLTFTTTNYAAKTVTIRAPDDAGSVNESVTLRHAAAGAVSGFAGVSKDLTVAVTDNDRPNILLSEPALTVGEESSSAVSYTVRLVTAPTADVTVTVTASGDLTIDGPDTATAFTASETLTFSTTTWDDVQTINVKAAADNDLADDAARIDHRAASTDSGYAGISKSLPVTVTDDDTGSLMLSETARTVTEGDDAGETYTVKLSHRPSAAVTVAITSADDEAAATPASLTFNAGNWNRAQTVRVTAVADADLADATDTLTHTASATGGYTAGATAAVSVTVQDTTAPGITLSEAMLSVAESSGDSYTVVLDNRPAADVTVAISSGNSAVRVDPASASLDFTAGAAGNWNVAQTVTVTTTTDDDDFANASALTHTPSIRGIDSGVTLLPVLLLEPVPADSSVPTRTILTPPPAGAPAVEYTIDTQTVTVSSDAGADIPDGVEVSTTQRLTEDLTITFSVLEGIPTTLAGYTLDGATLVGISVTPAAPADGLEICLPRGDGSTRLLHYQSGRWRVVPGSEPRGDQVCGTVTEFSPFIAGQPAAVAPETEPERPPIIYNLNIRFDARRIALPEGHQATYRVRLAGPPSGRGANIRIRSDNPDVRPTPAELRFTAADWNEWQEVQVSIANDRNHTDESATLAHYGPNRGYGSLLVSVTDTGNNPADAKPGPSLTVVTEPGARWGVTVRATAPADLAAHGVVRVSPAYGAPRTAAGYGLGRNGAAQAIVRIAAAEADVPASGLTVCLPVARALAEEAGERRLTLLRYGDAESGGGWQAAPGAEYDAVGRMVCAAGVTGFGAFAAAYVLP